VNSNAHDSGNKFALSCLYRYDATMPKWRRRSEHLGSVDLS
jgi:hypothetical protein